MNKEDYFKYYIQGSDHYLLPKDIFNELFQEMVNWREEAQYLRKILHKININGVEEENTSVLDLINENKELKEMIDEEDGCNKRRLQIFNLKDKLCKELKNIKILKQENKILKEQQKEFINFLESMWQEKQDIWYIKILSKYKEIIGENNE